MDNESIFFITGMVLVPLTFLIVGILLLRWLCTKGLCGKALSVVIAGVAAYFIITNIWPTQGFYIEEFEGATGLPFPASADFVHKCSTFPDSHGDYSSEAVFILSEEDFAALKAHLESAQSAKDGPQMPQHENMATEELLMWQTISKDTNDHFSWGIMKDGQTAFFKYVRT